jgi:hypothetical protein
MADKKDRSSGSTDGHKWYKDAEKSPLRSGLDPSYPNKPHENGNREYNEGVKEGIERARREKK